MTRMKNESVNSRKVHDLTEGEILSELSELLKQLAAGCSTVRHARRIRDLRGALDEIEQAKEES